MKHSAWATAALAVSATVVIAGCGSSNSSAPSAGATSSSASAGSGSSAATTGKFLGCMVSDTGGVDDRSFNAASWAGMQAAAQANSNITVKFSQSTSPSDYTPIINTFLSQKCNIIVTLGFAMGDATKAAAKANAEPEVRDRRQHLQAEAAERERAGVQHGAGRLPRRLPGRGHDQDRQGRDVRRAGVPDRDDLHGRLLGRRAVLQLSKHGTHVQVLGWNEKTQKGSFTGDFTNQTKGQTLTQTFISEGADIIFPVAGNVGLGAAKAVQQADAAAGSQKVNMEWVDLDGCVSAAQYCKYFITSVLKGETLAVKTAVLAAASGSFKGGNYIGTLANGGVSLAPFHDFDSKVPASLKSELQQISKGIQNGSIQTPTKSPVSG